MTYIFAGYDQLHDPTVVTPGWDYFCLSDEGHASDIWKPLPPIRLHHHITCPKRRSSLAKILHQKYLPKGYDYCLTVDGAVLINCDLNAVLKEFIHGNPDIVLARHPERDCLYDEAKKVTELRFDDPEVIRDQTDRYAREGFPTHYGLYSTRIMLKRNSSHHLDAMCNLWAQEYVAGSRRDQLTLTYAIWRQELAGRKVRVQSFDFRDVFHDRQLFVINSHLGSREWKG